MKGSLVGSTAFILAWAHADRNKLKMSRCIDHITQDIGSHRIAMEGVEKGKQVNCKTYGINIKKIEFVKALMSLKRWIKRCKEVILLLSFTRM